MSLSRDAHDPSVRDYADTSPAKPGRRPIALRQLCGGAGKQLAEPGVADAIGTNAPVAFGLRPIETSFVCAPNVTVSISVVPSFA